MRVFCFALLSMLAAPLHAATWECKPPLDVIPWSKVNLVAVTGDADNATILYGGKTYAADYVRKGSTHFWRIDKSVSGDFGAVLSIRAGGSGLMQQERVISGTIVHVRVEFICRSVRRETE